MTGFGSADGRVGEADVSVELRTVNHRFFNPTLKLPATFGRWESEVRELLRQRIVRGHVTAFVRATRERETVGVAVDEARVAAYVAQLRAIRDRLGLAGDVDLATVLRLPDVLVSGTALSELEDAGGTAAELLAIVDAAATQLAAMRDAEGARLAGFLRDRLTVVEDALARIGARAPERLVAQRDRLRASVRELLDGAGVDEQRVAQEIAILADRLDVSEELDRFRAHIAAARATLVEGAPDGIGKRLGFLVQEMLREANTTGSKANDAAMLSEVVTIKEELERIREQVENLE